MEKRIGTILIAVDDPDCANQLNSILSAHADIIRARQGLPSCIDGISIISLVLEGTTDEIGSLSGQIGKLSGLQSRSVLLKNK